MEEYTKFINNYKVENIENLKTLETDRKNLTEMKNKLTTFRDKLTMDVLVPIPSHSPLAFFEGIAMHTNELLVMLGAKYFAKMTTSDTIQFCDRKILDIDDQITNLMDQRKSILDRFALLNFDNSASSPVEIIEEYDEETEKIWRARHAELLKKNKMKRIEEE